MRVILTLILFLALARPAIAQSACMTSSPSQEEMDQAFLASLKGATDGQKTRIAFFPFQDGSLLNPDTTLAILFPILFYEMTPAENRALAFHPFVTHNAVRSKSFTHEDLFSDDKIAQLAKELGATHAVYGMFQKQTGADLRFFVKITALDQKKPVKTLEFMATQGDRIFESVHEALGAVLAEAGVKAKKSKSNPYLLNTPSFEALRFYGRGMEGSATYNETNLAIAKVWFEKAATTSYHFKRAWAEKARTLLMMALVLKQRGMDYSLLLNEAAAALKEAGSPDWVSRWVDANAAFASGMSLLQGNNASAAGFLEKAVKSVPEDGMARHYLAQAYAKSGNGRSAAETQAAQKLNPCLGSPAPAEAPQ